VKQCYDAVVTIHPTAAGKMTVRFGITSSGWVATSCLVDSELNAASVDLCVLDRLRAWKFPQPDGGGWVIVTYPFDFSR
jgi:hypothetical protein